jgi:hypothetical protein
MAHNLYHILNFLPATEAWEMPPALEKLAQQIVSSGKLRINADHERNFVRYGTANSDLTFTARELTEPALKTLTHQKVARLVAPAMGEQGIADIWAYLANELKKARGVDVAKEMRVARVLVQAADPAVIQLLSRSGTEIFVSYSHNVADLLPVHEWQGHGMNSGMQATESSGTAVYISCGGDPFFEGTQKTYLTDGFPALARMMVIAGQEIGHFADLRRTASGIIGRHSTDPNHSRLRANPIAAEGRLRDMAHLRRLASAYQVAGLPRLIRAEKRVDFYHTRLRYSPQWFIHQLWRCVVCSLFIYRCTQKKLWFNYKVIPAIRLGHAIEAFLADMAFNLAPEADVYRHPDPQVEEAIAVIEAVARVPQQAHKWGDTAVAIGWPNLHRFYYGTVIGACKQQIKNPLSIEIMSLTQKIIIYLRRHFQTKPGYYP